MQKGVLLMLYLNAKFAKLWRGKDPFVEVLGLDGKEYRSKEGRRTVQLVIDDKSYFLKTHQGVGWKEIFKNLLQLRLPVIGASNEYFAANRLRDLGIDTLTPVTFGKRGLNPAQQLSFLITEDISNTVSLEEYCADWKAKPPAYAHKKALIELLAHVTKIMHQTGINHRDYYLCHFLLDKNSIKNMTSPKCYLIDLHRAQIRNKVPRRWKIKDLAGLYFSAMDIGLSARDLYRFIHRYSDLGLSHELKNNMHEWSSVISVASRLYLKENDVLPAKALK